MTTVPQEDYIATIEAWRASMDESLRRDDGWLSLAGLFWLSEGVYSVGSDPLCEILLPESAPANVGEIRFDRLQASIKAINPVIVDGVLTTEAVLRDDHNEAGPSMVDIGPVLFYVIRRGDQVGVRVRDRNSEARRTFSGRKWYSIDPAWRISATFHPNASPRTYSIVNSVNIVEKLDSPGEITFDVLGQSLRLVAFKEGEDQLWFIFKDATNGDTTYKAGRFLKTPLPVHGVVDLDFNRAYSPPCAFTPFATCPLPPKENVLPVAIAVGERD
jgi:uncharacterized protein